MKLSQAIADFLASLEAEGRSRHTIGAYRRDLATFRRFCGDVPIKSVTPDLLVSFMAHDSVRFRPCGARRAKPTINRYRVSLKALFAFCAARWLVDRNPTAVLKCKRHRGLPPVILTNDEIERVLSFDFTGRHAKRDRALLTFMLTTGCRLGETVALNVGDIDLENGTAILRHPKGDEPDRIPLSERCITATTTLCGLDRSQESPLFATSTGARLSSRQVQRIVEARMREAGIKKHITPHGLRHTFATKLYNCTGDIRLVQQALRHQFVTTSQYYAHVDPLRWRQAVEVISTAR